MADGGGDEIVTLLVWLLLLRVCLGPWRVYVCTVCWRRRSSCACVPLAMSRWRLVVGDGVGGWRDEWLAAVAVGVEVMASFTLVLLVVGACVPRRARARARVCVRAASGLAAAARRGRREREGHVLLDSISLVRRAES